MNLKVPSLVDSVYWVSKKSELPPPYSCHKELFQLTISRIQYIYFCVGLFLQQDKVTLKVLSFALRFCFVNVFVLVSLLFNSLWGLVGRDGGSSVGLLLYHTWSTDLKICLLYL
ncbi:hypothetical protein ISN45_Aa02g027700 [Arabidopsis thaliana x Arabidopsis arenosa]|uniref:Transmembrane protein n=1 Tax=Arabidopsis thaliana x Arabidopsis arenosa TaxID=1240361 RepID=A0A8T2BP99_9BRAS|nr:hypothetical protein ISN45_Aa02g027700 [Arabidopsis thaliana x Arabidopsis arenosa]